MWMFTGLSFVIASLLEGATVSYLEACETEGQNAKVGCFPGKKNMDQGDTDDKETRRLIGLVIHKVSRVLFPLAYVMFFISYWMFYVKG